MRGVSFTVMASVMHRREIFLAETYSLMRWWDVFRERAFRDRIFILKVGGAGVDEGVTPDNHRALRVRCRMISTLGIACIAVYALGCSGRAGVRRVRFTTLCTR